MRADYRPLYTQVISPPETSSGQVAYCWCDGSFREPMTGGTGYICFHNDIVVQYGGEGCDHVLSPFHMEGLGIDP